MCTAMPPPARGSLPTIDPYGKVVTAMRRPATLVLLGLASAAAIGHAFRAPFPGTGENSVLDLVAYHDPALHTVIRIWQHDVLFRLLGLNRMDRHELGRQIGNRPLGKNCTQFAGFLPAFLQVGSRDRVQRFRA